MHIEKKKLAESQKPEKTPVWKRMIYSTCLQIPTYPKRHQVFRQAYTYIDTFRGPITIEKSTKPIWYKSPVHNTYQSTSSKEYDSGDSVTCERIV